MLNEVTTQAQRQLTELIGRRNDSHGNVQSHEIISSRELSELPTDLTNLLSKKQTNDLNGILRSLYELDNKFAGTNTIEAEVSICVSGDAELLFEDCRKWFAKYVERRLLKERRRNKYPASHRFNQLYTEFHELFSPLFNRPQSLGYVFFDEPNKHATFHFFEAIFAPFFSQIYPNHKLRDPKLDWPRREKDRFVSEAHQAELLLRLFAGQQRWNLNRFYPFLEVTAKVSKIRSSANVHRLKAAIELKNELAQVAADIRAMRPLLVGGNPNAFVADIGSHFIGLQWSLRFGIATLCIGATREEVVREVNMPGIGAASLPIATVHQDGHLSDVTCPWFTTSNWKNPDAWAINLAVLEFVRDFLFEKYDKIDLNAIRVKGRTGEYTEEEEVQVLAVESFDLELGESTSSIRTVDVEDREFRIVSSLKRNTFLSRLKKFGCDWIPSKGSHIKVRRDDHSYPLSLRDEYNPYIQKDCLRALGISTQEWVSK